MSLTNGKPKALMNDDWWKEVGAWKLYGIRRDGTEVALNTPIYRGNARAASELAAQIAHDMNYRCHFLQVWND